MAGLPKRHYSVIILVVLLVMTLTLLLSNLRERSSLNALEKGAVAALAPFQDFVGWSAARMFMVWDNYIHLVKVKEENQRLTKQVEKLAFENALLTERFKHYERLDSLLSFPSLSNISYVAARIIGRDTTGRVRLLIINKGSNDGIEEAAPVITRRGLVGRVVRVSGSASKVLMITDVRSAVDGVVQETRDSLVTVGTNTGSLDAKYLAVGSGAKDGDRLISSGLGGVYPKGLLIGFLKDTRTHGDSLFLSALVEPAADLDRIEEVLALKGSFAEKINPEDWK